MTPLLLPLLLLLVKSLAVFALAGLTLLALRRASAASRHLVCLLTLAALLALPLLWWTPSLPVSMPRLAGPLTPNSGGTGGSDLTPRPLLPQGEGAGADGTDAVGAGSPRPSSDLPAFPNPSRFGRGGEPKRAGVGSSPTPPELGAGGRSLLALWLLGVLAAALRPLLGLWGIGRLHRSSRAETSPAVLTLAADCAAALGLAHIPTVRRGDVPVPITWGLRCPVVLLPDTADTWPEGRLEAVLLHELAHIRRRDWAAHRLADLACALYWFHPLVWLTARRLRDESELACDDLVLSCGIPAPDYACHLLDIARALSPAKPSAPTGAIGMARTIRVEGRITQMLNPTQNRRAVTHRTVFAALLAAALGVGTLAALRPAARAETSPSVSAAPQRQETGVGPKYKGSPSRSLLLLKYCGSEGYLIHRYDAPPAQSRPSPKASMYGRWAEAYGGIKSGNSEKFLLRAQALDPNNPQWADRLGTLYNVLSINAQLETAHQLAQKALTQYELAVRLLGAGPGTSSDTAVTAFNAGEYQKARQYADGLLQRNGTASEWEFPGGEEAYHAHLVLGLLALHDGNPADAEAQLLSMGRLFSSPIRYENGFGPNMSLAKSLLLAGHRDAVLAYLDECGKVWKRPELAAWRSDVQQGKTPNFGPNVYY